MSSAFTITLNSANTDFGTSANFQIDLEKSGIPFSEEEILVGLDYVIIPNMLYPIRSGRNQLVFDEGGGDLTATIADGYYDSTSFCTALKTAMELVSAGATYTITVSSTTNKITITKNAGTFTMKFSSTTTSADMWKILGFAYNTDTTAAITHTGTMPVRLDNDEYFCLNLESLNSSNISSAFSTRGIFDIIPMNVNYGEMVYYQPNQTTNFVRASMNDLKFIRVRITDQNGYEIPITDNCEILIKLRVIPSQLIGFT